MRVVTLTRDRKETESHQKGGFPQCGKEAMMARRQGRRTDYSWANCGDLVADVDPGAAAVFVCGLQVVEAATVTRIRGRIGAVLDAGGLQEHVMLLAGITIVGSDAFAAGIAPELFSAAGPDEASWVWQGSLFLTSGAEPAVVPDGLSASLEIDTKAMRRVKNLEVVALVVEIPAELALDQAGVVDVIGFLHLLTGT